MPPLLLVPLVLNLLRRGHARVTWLESHFRLQLNAFLIALAVFGLIAEAPFFLSGLPYLVGVPVDAGSLSEGLGLTFGLLFLAVLLAPLICLLIHMTRSLSALNRGQAA
ncbi:MAG: hypothetical protein AB1593_10435 [Pseudomonadota bacterium]